MNGKDEMNLERDVPQVLTPGDVCAEWSLYRPTDRDALVNGLAVLGLDVDEGRIGLDDSKVLQATPESPARFRFVGTLRQAICPRDTPSIRWKHARNVQFDVFGDVNLRPGFFPLVQATRYEMRIFARMRSTPTEQGVEEALKNMGFAEPKLILLKRDIRLPGRNGASVSQWYAEGTWTKGQTYATDFDPILIEDLAALGPVAKPETVIDSAPVEGASQAL